MSKFTIPNTDVSLKGTLKDGGAFADSSGTSLNTYGSSNRIPRVTSNISIDSHFRNRDFVRFVNIISTDNSGQNQLGSVQVTSPFSEGPAQSVSLGVTYVFDTSAQTTITLAANVPAGHTFNGYYNQNLTVKLAIGNPATISLINTNVATATGIVAVFDEVGGST